MNNIENIYIVRYAILPIVGFLAGAITFILFYKKGTGNYSEKLESFLKLHHQKILYSAASLYLLYYLAIITLRYYSGHLGIFDFGIYDHRIWQIHMIPWGNILKKLTSSAGGHFHPILILYSILYDLGTSPVALSIFQAFTILSGLIPLYLIAKLTFKNRTPLLWISLLYLLYPATQFNIAFDFHPDHLIIPLLFWCYYFIKRENYLVLIPLIAIAYTIKEPLILSIAFLGLYIAWEKKKHISGITLFLISTVIFYIVTFVIVPLAGNNQIETSVQGISAFGYIFSSENSSSFVKEFFRFEKWRFPFFLLFPVLFLPVLRFKKFLPAIPLLLIPILSTVTAHQNVASHYTAGIIPPVFVSLISATAYLYKKHGERLVTGIMAWIFILMIFFNIAHSPSPLAIAFWDKNWSHGYWHYTNYIANDHKKILKEAINLIPDDPSVKIVVHSGIYDKNLTQRYYFNLFPMISDSAEYILLDNRCEGYVIDWVDEDLYKTELLKLQANTTFKQIYDKDGVLLFKRAMK